MSSYQDGSPLEFWHGHKREQSQDSGAYIDWNSEDSASPVGNPDATGHEDFITVVAVENGGGGGGGGEGGVGESEKNQTSSFVTILAIGDSEEDSGKSQQNDKEEEVLVYRLPGERLGFGLKFEGGTNTAENVKRLFIQSSAPDSPASRAKCSWGSLVEGDEILKIDGHIVKNMTRLDCVRCLKESSVVIKLYVRHKSQKGNQQPNRIKVENASEIRVNNPSSSSPMVVNAEIKKNIPPPPPVPPRKIVRKSPVPASKEEQSTVNPPDGFYDFQNGNNPVPKARNIQGSGAGDETSKNLSKFVIRVPQKGNHDSPDSAKRNIKRNGPDFKLIPPEPKVYLDLLAQEDSRNCESESDDTGSTISTVVGLSSMPNTTNSSFSDLRSSASSFCDSTNPSTPTSEPTTPVLDLSRVLSPYDHNDNNEFLFTKLINGKDQDILIGGYEEKSLTNCQDDIAPLQPPLSFQDAPLSYGNEEMRANLTENLEFCQDESLSDSLKNRQEDIVCENDSSFEIKYKDNNNAKPTILSKKPSLIPRLAKSIGLLSPPKPSPRKDSNPDGSKSRFNKKKPPPLPPSADGSPIPATESTENKTLKSSIPYLKKKKNKNEDSKKSSKADKKSKMTNSVDESSKGKSILMSNDSVSQHEENGKDDGKRGLETLKTTENDNKLTWEVPDLKNSKEVINPELDVSKMTKMFNGNETNDVISISEQEKFLSDLGNNDFKAEMSGTCDSHFLFQWSGSKQLETIGEDEEDFGVDEVSERSSSNDKKKHEKSFIQIVEETDCNEEENPTNENKTKLTDKEEKCDEEAKTDNLDDVNASTEKPEEKETSNECNEFKEELPEAEDSVNETDEQKVVQEELREKEDESEANGPKYKNTLCNDHVLVKLDNDSLEVVKNVDLNPSNDEIKENMVPVMPASIGVSRAPSCNRMPPDGHEFPQNYTEGNISESDSITAKIQDKPQVDSGEAAGLPPLPASEPPSTPQKIDGGALVFDGEPETPPSSSSSLEGGKYSSGRTTKPGRNSFWRQDEKSEKSVRDKIAMFSSVASDSPSSSSSPSSGNGSGKLNNKYKSSDNVFYYEDGNCGRNFQNGKFYSRSILSLDKVSGPGSPYVKKTSYGDSSSSPRSLDYSNRTQSSMDLSSSSSAYSSSCSPDSSLSSNSSYLGYSSTLPRKKTRAEEGKSLTDKKEPGIKRTTSFSIHGRSQSLLDVNPSPYKLRHLSESSQDDTGSKAGSLNLLIEQRRKNLSKLRGLVIPEKLTDSMPSQPIVDLPEIKSRDLILSSKVPNAFKEKTKMANSKWVQSNPAPEGTTTTTAPKVSPSHLWDIQSKTANIPKYSPAFKRKSISVFGAKEPSLNPKKEIFNVQKTLQEPGKAPIKPPRTLNNSRHNYGQDSRKYQDSVISSALSDGEFPYVPERNQRVSELSKSVDAYVPKRKSMQQLQGKYRSYSDRVEEDSDNDSAVSSSRSSISHGFSPPASPLLDSQYQGVEDPALRSSSLMLTPERSPLTRTLSTDTTTSNTSTLTAGSQASAEVVSDATSKRILKPQSVEAINRKNVLASAKYSRGFDVKSGLPLIQPKFVEEVSSDIGPVVESDLSHLTDACSLLENHLARRYSAGSYNRPTETMEKPQKEKVAYINDVEDVGSVRGDASKKKLEKSESLPSAPITGQPQVSRRTSVPFAYSWEVGNSWNTSNRKPVEGPNYLPLCSKESRDVMTNDKLADESLNTDKDLESCRSSRVKTDKSPADETDTRINSINLINESVGEKMKNLKAGTKSGQTSATDKISVNGNPRSVSVNDIRKAFEKPEALVSAVTGRTLTNKPANVYSGVNGNHVRVSSLDSTTSEDGFVHGQYGLSSNLQREQYGSITSLASSTSLISPQELQLLIEEANQTLEESGSNAGGSSPNNHDVLVIILHRDTVGGSVGITLAGGADYESKEITVHKVLAGSPADRDGRIQKGDRILSINGKSMKGVTHRESLAILKSPRLEVVLVVSRLKSDASSESVNADDTTPVSTRHSFLSGSSRPPRILEGSTLNETDESVGTEIPRGPPVTLVLVKDGAGLGFSLEGGKDCPTGDKPLVIKKIFTGGAAEKCGYLKAGDELVNVNGIDVSVMSRIEAWKMMKQLPDGNVTITVKHQVDDNSGS